MNEGVAKVKLAIMQPYFLPYIGYFQLMAAVDVFVIYDRIKYTKKGWINRNRMLRNGRDELFTLPLSKASDSCDIIERDLAQDFDANMLLKQWRGAYAKAPYFAEVYPLLERIMQQQNPNLFHFIHASLVEVAHYLGITTEIRIASEVAIDHTLRGEEKVIALCEALKAETYINAIGGTELYDREHFAARGITLNFIRAKPITYTQFGNEFVPWLSILDVLMFNPREVVQGWVDQHFELL